MSENRLPRHIALAYDFGLMKEGWCLKDYVMHAAIAPDGYEVIVVDGVQRSGKSNQSLQIDSWGKQATHIFKLNNVDYSEYKKEVDAGLPPADYMREMRYQPSEKDLWEDVLESVLFKAGTFVSYLKVVPDGEPTDVVCWDDIAGHYTNLSFRIDPEEYAQVDSAFTVLGTKARIIITNIPNVTRLSKNIKDHCSFEIFIGRNRRRLLRRIFRLPGIRNINMNEFKADVEAPSDFDIFRVPEWAWRTYEKRRFDLAQEVFKSLGETVEMDKAPEGYVSIPDAIRLARDNGLGWGALTIQQNASRSLYKKVKAGGYLFIEQESFMKIVDAEKYTAVKKR